MATSLRKWTIPSVYIWIYMVLFLDCMVCNGDLFSYTNSTQSVLCEAQCEALCQDKVSNCIPKCAGQRHWMADCDRPNCTSTCSVLYAYHYQNRGELVHVPHVSLNRTGPLTIELAWNVPTHISPNPASNVSTIIYIVEETHPDPRLQGVHSVSIKQWTRGTTVKLDLKDMCNTDSYRVMAINQIGSMGFSAPVQIPAMPAPGLVSNISFVGNGVYYYVNKDNKDQSMFMAILQWDPPAGWQDSEISRYRWNPMVKRYCSDLSQDSLPLFTIMKNRSRHILIKIASNSINCVFTTQVQAVSKCNKNGPWTDFLVDLRNCSAITGYKCHQDGQDGSDPPGPVQNVTLNVTSSPVLVMMQMNPNPYIINQYTNSPLLINLHVKWKPPSDMGSYGIIDHYTIRSGVAKINLFPVPPSFIGTPHEIKVSKDIHDLSFPIPTQNIPYTFGIQVRAVGPYQEVPENDWGVLRMRTIDVRRSDSAIGPFMKEGKVLLDEAGIVILHVNNSLPVQFLPSPPMGNDTNIDRYAVQWGPMDGPDSMTVENTTIIPLNQTSLTVSLLNDDVKMYGVKVIYLREEEEEPGLEDWENTTLWTFTNPFADDQVENIVQGDQLTPLYVMIGVVVSMILTSVAVKYLLRRHHFKHLEERLMSYDDEIGEDGDHYFVMRLPDHDTGDDTDIPTVVADHWELPHCCLKMGRILGSGAFGQVVKGRVSKSLLMHRGIDSHTTHTGSGIGTHVIVAVKMLQDRADETHIQNFLKEIDMMKDIGYHRNIVSILGCCTLRQPYCLVVEHMPHGDLLTYFRNIRNKMEQKETEDDGYINQDIDMFSPRDLLSVARQITTGMDFLSQKGFVHRDLAARNILVGNDKTVKIGDFGLARYIYNDVNKIYVTRRGGKLPLRWMSPEAIFDMTFSTASDIWSFGIVLYEIVTLGGSPYPAMSNVELLQALKHGYRMPKPDNCSQEIYDIMLECWKEQSETRPSFSQLCNTFTRMLEEDSYLEYFNFNVALAHDYYRINSDTMDDDIFDLDDQGYPINLNSMPGTSQNVEKIPSQLSIITTEIPDHDCIIQEMSKAERNEDTISYTDSNFIVRVGTSSSFNNGLYPTIENGEKDKLNIRFGSNLYTDDNISSNVPNKQQEETDTLPNQKDDTVSNIGYTVNSYNKAAVENRTSASSDRTSASSDDVFTNCPGCTRLATLTDFDAGLYEDCSKFSEVPIDGGFSQCPDCGRLDLHLTPFDIHVSERNDSAICSTASDDSDQSQSNQSDSSIAISEVYLMPDSPLAESTDTNTFSFDVSEKILNHDHSDNIDKDDRRKRWHFENPCYTGLYERGTVDNLWNDRNLLKNRYIDNFLMKQSKSDGDIWCIAETKL